MRLNLILCYSLYYYRVLVSMTWGELSCGAVGRTVAAISGENLLMANLQQERVTSLDVIVVLNVNI